MLFTPIMMLVIMNDTMLADGAFHLRTILTSSVEQLGYRDVAIPYSGGVLRPAEYLGCSLHSTVFAAKHQDQVLVVKVKAPTFS